MHQRDVYSLPLIFGWRSFERISHVSSVDKRRYVFVEHVPISTAAASNDRNNAVSLHEILGLHFIVVFDAPAPALPARYVGVFVLCLFVV